MITLRTAYVNNYKFVATENLPALRFLQTAEDFGVTDMGQFTPETSGTGYWTQEAHYDVKAGRLDHLLLRHNTDSGEARRIIHIYENFISDYDVEADAAVWYLRHEGATTPESLLPSNPNHWGYVLIALRAIIRHEKKISFVDGYPVFEDAGDPYIVLKNGEEFRG